MENLAITVNTVLQAKSMILATAESCTGGWVAKVMTDIAGSSASFDCGFVTYSNAAKQNMLGVSVDTLERYGSVSKAVVKEMAEGALLNSIADIALSISGIAGPGGGTEDQPVGTVCFAWKTHDSLAKSTTHHFAGDRAAVRRQAVLFALQGVLDILKNDD